MHREACSHTLQSGKLPLSLIKARAIKGWLWVAKQLNAIK